MDFKTALFLYDAMEESNFSQQVNQTYIYINVYTCIYIYIYIYNWQQYYPKLIFLNICVFVYIKRIEVGGPIASYRRKAVVDNTRKMLYI